MTSRTLVRYDLTLTPAATPRLYFQILCQHEVFRVISTMNAGSLCSRHVNYGNTINVFLFF